MTSFSEEMDAQLPLLGLIGWNLRHLKLFTMEQELKVRSNEKRNPYLMKNLERWRKHWTVKDLSHLEHALFQIDFSLKNTRLTGLGLWSKLLMESAAQ